MTDQRFIITTPRIQANAIESIVLDEQHPVEVIVRPHEKKRTTAQNSRYWAGLTQFHKELQAMVQAASDHTGYDPAEVREHIAHNLPTRQALILFARKPEVIHEVLKDICGIPTSTRLGTKKFMEFEEQMERAMAEVMGTVNDVTARMVA